jgi:peptidoglycan DL-endopeptidase CwlO
LEQGRSHPAGETPAPQFPRSAWLWRVPALGAAALMAAAAWPGAASAVAQPAPASAGVWLLGRTAPTLLPPADEAAPGTAAPAVAPLRRVLPVDVVAVSAKTFPAAAVAAVRRLTGVRAAETVDAARIQVNGRFVAVLGVDPSRFRRFAAKPTAKDTAFWRSVAGGSLGLSYEMGKQDKLPTGMPVRVVGRQAETMRVGRLGTVGIGGVDAVISDKVARSLGFPVNNAIIVSAPNANLAKLARHIKAALPRSAQVDQIAVQRPEVSTAAATAAAGASQQTGRVELVASPVIKAMLLAALSRVGMPYVWGAAGPTAFDCSGLVQWSFARAGVVMPRVAADQARTGPEVPVSQLQPGDLLFYHTDPTAPDYISHVAIYLGDGKMIQAPEPGEYVEIVPVDLGSDFAGAVDVAPEIAAQVAASSV